MMKLASTLAALRGTPPAPALALLVLPALSGCAPDAPGAESAFPHPADDVPVALVTGSTDGLGRALAMELAADGYHVIVHGRSEERGREVVEAIEAGGAGSARFFRADFASLDEVAELAARILGSYDRLDLLVNNAGVGPGPPGHERVLTDDGHELRFQVNYLAGYLLTRELIPLLQAAAVRGGAPRIVSVTSRNQQPLDFDDLRMDRAYSGSLAYGRSKLAQILFTVDLAEELAPTGVRAFAVHPAPAMDTGLVLEAGGTPQSTVADGLRAVLQAVRTDAHPSGTFFFELEARPAHEQAYDPEARRRLRALSEGFVAAGAGAP